MDKMFLTVKEVCDMTGWGQTKVRELVNNPKNKFTLRLGNRIYVDREMFIKYLKRCMDNNIAI